MQRFEKNIVLITGATGGLGVPMCQRLTKESATVIATDLPEPAADAVILDGVEHLLHDVGDEARWIEIVQHIKDTYGRLDVLINNAGLNSIGDVVEEELERWEHIITVNQTGTWLGMKHAGPFIESSGGGVIVNISSLLGSTGGLANNVAYHAAKGAVRTMTKNAALYWAKRHVRVNSLHPGFIGTTKLLNRYEGTQRHAAMLANTPMGRLGTPEEVAATVAFMASDDASYMTGAELYLDGGWTAR